MESQSNLLRNSLVTLAASLAMMAALALPGRAIAADVEQTQSLGILTSPVTLGFHDSISQLHLPGTTFLDHFTFSLSPPSNFNSFAATLDLGTVSQISGISASLFTGGGALVASGIPFGSALSIVPTTSIASGAYDLRVSGTVTGTLGGSFAGTLNASPTAPIPEPETYAMMLAGLGLMGFVARRRKQGLEHAYA